MSGVERRLPQPLRCVAASPLTAIEAAKLGVSCSEVPAAEAWLRCELVAGHDASHVAFAAIGSDGELWWWLRWGAQDREIRQIDLCDGRHVDDPYLDDCLLPGGHPGPHSFELQDADSADPTS